MVSHRHVAVVSFTFFAILLGLTAAARGAPSKLRLSFVEDTATSMTVTWNTTAAAASEVRYGTAPGQLASTATATSFEANSGLGHVHSVTLTGLQPDTTYYYSAGSAADGFSAEKTFTTGPAEHESCGRFKFVYLGDNRPDPIFGGGQNWPQILGQSVQQQPDFVLNGGDLVIDGDQIDQWQKLLDWTEPVASLLAFMPSIGNHDDGPGEGDGANYNQLFTLPRSSGPNGSDTEDYYFFTYANAIFVSLSTDTFKDFNKQAAWLDEVLTNNPKKWKLVFYHKPTYTNEVLFNISHEPNEEGQNAAFVPVIDKHHVDVVLTSHNHWYERYEPSACGTKGTPGSNQPCSVGASNFSAGTVYYVSGGAGAFTIPGFLCGQQSGRAICSGNHHYIIFDIDNEVLKVETWGAFPQTNQVIDSITIKKSADTCPLTPDAGPPDGLDSAVSDLAALDASAPGGEPVFDGPPATQDATAPTNPPGDGCGCATTGDQLGGAGALLLTIILLGARRRRRRA
jgi:MYXO-CTERM domain-containing protein